MNARSWRDLAACLDVVSADYDPFFADSAELQAEAITICTTCPVRDVDFPPGGGHRGYAAVVDGSGLMAACCCSHSMGGR